jgi:hypothetical protein
MRQNTVKMRIRHSQVWISKNSFPSAGFSLCFLLVQRGITVQPGADIKRMDFMIKIEAIVRGEKLENIKSS